MTPCIDLPASAVRLITRSARTRHIQGTNRFAGVCRSWRDAAANSEDQEQLQLLLELQGLPAGTFTSTAQWLAQHGQCVTSLHIAYGPDTAPLFQQLPLSSAPFVGLARLEVDGPDSLVALAPVLPQLVALTHLGASISLVSSTCGAPAVFSAQIPLQQLCPGLKSLHLTIDCNYSVGLGLVGAPLVELAPAGLEELRLKMGSWVVATGLDSEVLTSLTALRRLHITDTYLDPDALFCMPALDQLHLPSVQHWVDGDWWGVGDWLAAGACAAPQHLTKLTGMSMVQVRGDQVQLVAAAVPGLRRLAVSRAYPSAPSAQQLSCFGRLRHLGLFLGSTPEGGVAAALGAMPSFPHLTSMHLGTSQAGVPRSTWAVCLQHLPQLRVLSVPGALLLEGGLAPELTRLTQLRCLYVECSEWQWEPAARGAEVAAHLEVLSQCSSLRAVLCWSSNISGDPTSGDGIWGAMHQGKLHLSAWHKWSHAAKEGRVVCPRPCPHLPGVWELQQQEPADSEGSD